MVVNSTQLKVTTLFIVFGVTYKLELRNAANIYKRSHSFTNKSQIGCLDIIRCEHAYLVETYITSKKLQHYVILNRK